MFWVGDDPVLPADSSALIASENDPARRAGGNIHENAPYAIAQIQLILSLFYMFVTTAFVANVVVRDDETGFGPIIRSTRITKFDYLFGRFSGAFAVAALGYLAVPLGICIGSLMPWVDPETLGPQPAAPITPGPTVVLALPNMLITSAIFFALATATRSMMTTYVGVVAFCHRSISSMTAWSAECPSGSRRSRLAEPFGIGAFGMTTRYWTAAERNALAAGSRRR